jgi:phage terminase large subunit GpA-like protein
MVESVKKRPAKLSKWLENVLFLPAGVASEPGKVRLYPYQRAIADAIADPRIERVSIFKSARIGFSTLLVGGIAHYVVRDPAPILVVMPTMS